MIVEAFLKIIFILLVSIIGYFLTLLTLSGVIAATIVGIGVVLGFGVKGLIVLGFFFLSSSIFSKYRKKSKMILDQKHTKGSQRDWVQVFANGGLAAFLGVFYFYIDSSLFLVGFLIAIAAATSDTWASEIGALSKKSPFFIRTFKRIEKGTSGAISLIGTLAGLAGSLTISLLAMGLFQLNLDLVLIIFVFGFIGNILDTLFGAFFQAAYQCNQCSIETEQSIHCQQPARLVRGTLFMNNDVVNFLSGLIATIMGIYAIM